MSDVTSLVVEIKKETKVVIGITLCLGLFIIWLCVDYFFFERAATTKDAFDAVVVNVLLPVFKILVAAVLGYVFGTPLVNSIAKRIANQFPPQKPGTGA
jgi:hypothetical protein